MNSLAICIIINAVDLPTGNNLLSFDHPDSPGAGRRHLAKKNSVVEGLIDPERDIYAIPSQVST